MRCRPDYPKRFGSIEDARGWARSFFSWYNDEYYRLLPPRVVHYGEAETCLEARTRVLAAAFTAHPECFVRGTPELPQLPRAVWINKLIETDATGDHTHENEVVQPRNRPETGDESSGSNEILVLTPGIKQQTLLEAAKTIVSA